LRHRWPSSTTTEVSHRRRRACVAAAVDDCRVEAELNTDDDEDDDLIPARAASARLPDLGLERTLMAADRTLMAWLRTSLSLYSFGFTMYKIMQSLAEAGTVAPRAEAPQTVGMFMASMGTLAMLMGTAQYWVELRKIDPARGIGRIRAPLIMAAVAVVVGVVMFFSILTHLF